MFYKEMIKMKSLKKVIAILLSSLMLASFCSLFSYAAEDITDFAVTAAVGEETVTVKWWKNGDNCCLFLPSEADTENLTLSFTASADVAIDGKAVESNSTISLEDKAF